VSLDVDSGWTASAMPSTFDDAWRAEMGDDIDPPLRYLRGELAALVGREPVAGSDDVRWHISISRPDRLPQWGELVQAAHELRPGVVFVIGVPPRSWWVNVHPYCLHLWECRDPLLVEQWRRESQGHRPT
jgi:hypothetical protein